MTTADPQPSALQEDSSSAHFSDWVEQTFMEHLIHARPVLHARNVVVQKNSFLLVLMFYAVVRQLRKGKKKFTT